MQKFDYTQIPCYLDVMNVLSERGDCGTTFGQIEKTTDGRGYTKTSIHELLDNLKMDGKTTERWIEEHDSRGLVVRQYRLITLNPEYRGALLKAE